MRSLMWRTRFMRVSSGTGVGSLHSTCLSFFGFATCDNVQRNAGKVCAALARAFQARSTTLKFLLGNHPGGDGLGLDLVEEAVVARCRIVQGDGRNRLGGDLFESVFLEPSAMLSRRITVDQLSLRKKARKAALDADLVAVDARGAPVWVDRDDPASRFRDPYQFGVGARGMRKVRKHAIAATRVETIGIDLEPCRVRSHVRGPCADSGFFRAPTCLGNHLRIVIDPDDTSRRTYEFRQFDRVRPRSTPQVENMMTKGNVHPRVAHLFDVLQT